MLVPNMCSLDSSIGNGSTRASKRSGKLQHEEAAVQVAACSSHAYCTTVGSDDGTVCGPPGVKQKQCACTVLPAGAGQACELVAVGCGP